jgi:hypothetical protein
MNIKDKYLALNALRSSIVHWERNAAGDDDGISPQHCALCRSFKMNDCKGCPVREKTGFMDCVETPYVEASKANKFFGPL